jgi:hypothetical protein
MKKDAMASAAEQLVATIGWLPELLRGPVQSGTQNNAASDSILEGALVAAE